MSGYEADLYEWTKAQADALRRRASNEIDWDNLAEEIESVGRSERREIRSRLVILLVHLLKWKFQPERRSASWEASIDEARRRLAAVIEDNPSLKRVPAEALPDVYADAKADKAIVRIGLLSLPDACPWTADEALNRDFLPE